MNIKLKKICHTPNISIQRKKGDKSQELKPFFMNTYEIISILKQLY